MNKLMLAVALTIALPGAAFAQAKPAPADSMQGMKMDGMSMQGMAMPKMSCKDMQAMMANGHSMAMSKAEMDKMCPHSKAAATSGASDAHQGHSSR